MLMMLMDMNGELIDQGRESLADDELPEESDKFAVLPQDRFVGQVVARRGRPLGRCRTVLVVLVVVMNGVRRRRQRRRRRARDQRQVGRNFVSDDAHALGREEADVEAALAPPPDALFGRRHVDD